MNEFISKFIPLLSLKIGGRRYNSKNSRDITIIYDEKTRRLCIRVKVEGEKGEPEGIYVLNRVSGEGLFLHSVNGSLEKMVVKLALETTDPVRFESSSGVDHVRCNMIALEASVEQAGSIRKLLMTLRNETFLQKRDAKLYEGIPQWSLLLPWWLYSKRLRITVQHLLMLYTIFNTFWALWQLYRHVDMIRDALEPLIILLQETCHIYVSFLMESIDFAMEHFSNFWWRFFAPLKVLVEPLLSQVHLLMYPLMKLSTLLYSMFGEVLFPVFSPLVNASIATTDLLWYMTSTILRPISWLLWMIFSYVLHPLLWYIPGLTKTVDPVKLFVRTLLMNSFKSMGRLLVWIARLVRIYRYSEKPTPNKDRGSRIMRRHTTEF